MAVQRLAKVAADTVPQVCNYTVVLYYIQYIPTPACYI